MMSEKRFFTKVNKQGKLVIIDKECHTELFDLYLACEVLNRLDLKRKVLNDENEQLKIENKKLRRTERSWKKIHCCNDESDNCGIVQSLSEENEQLRNELDKIPKSIREIWL